MTIFNRDRATLRRALVPWNSDYLQYRERRGAPRARREEGESWTSLTDEQRRTRRWIGARISKIFCSRGLVLACAALVWASAPALAQEPPPPPPPAEGDAEGDAEPAATWFYAVGDDELGPLTVEQVKKLFAEGKVSGKTKVRRKGPHNWAPLSETEQFAELFAWYYLKNGKRTGPVNNEAMGQLYRAGNVTLQTSVWRPGMAEWKPLAEVPEMAAELKTATSAPPPLATIRPAPTASPPPPGTGGLAVRKGKVVGYKREKRRGLVVSGAVTFGVTWGGSAIVSAILGAAGADGCDSCSDFAQTLWIPLVGPIVADQVNDPDSAMRTLMMAMISAGQCVGAGLFIAGMVGHKVPVYEKSPLYGWSVTPLVGPDQMAGVGFARFW